MVSCPCIFSISGTVISLSWISDPSACCLALSDWWEMDEVRFERRYLATSERILSKPRSLFIRGGRLLRRISARISGWSPTDEMVRLASQCLRTRGYAGDIRLLTRINGRGYLKIKLVIPRGRREWSLMVKIPEQPYPFSLCLQKWLSLLISVPESFLSVNIASGSQWKHLHRATCPSRSPTLWRFLQNWSEAIARLFLKRISIRMLSRWSSFR